MERMVQVSVFLAIICAVPTFGTDELVRNTKYGKVRGILSAEGQSYLGIPYGKAERFVGCFFIPENRYFFICKKRTQLNTEFYNVENIFEWFFDIKNENLIFENYFSILYNIIICFDVKINFFLNDLHVFIVKRVLNP